MSQSNRSFKRRALAYLGGLAFRAARACLRRRDPLAAERLGKRIGRFGRIIAGKQRTRCRRNLELIFPEMPEAKRAELGKRCFEHFGMLAADFFRADIRPLDEVKESVVEVEGWEHVEAVLAADKGCLAMTAHLGNWERGAAWSHSQGISIIAVQRDADDGALNDLVVHLRKASGVTVLSRGNASLAIMRTLREKKVVAILADQNAGEAYIDFMGYPAGTVIGPAMLSQKSGAPMLPNFCVRLGPNKYKVIIHEPIWPIGTDKEGAVKMMESLNRSYETAVREYPEQWLWFHDRWKNARKKGWVPGQ